MADFDRLMAELDTLTTEDRRAMLDYLQFQDSQETVSTNPPTRAMVETFDALVSALGPSMGRAGLGPMLKNVGRRRFEEACYLIDGFIKRACSVKLKAPEHQELRRRLIRCYVEFLRDIPGFPVTIENSVRNIHLFSQAVDDAFPGYAEAGLLHCVVLKSSRSFRSVA